MKLKSLKMKLKSLIAVFLMVPVLGCQDSSESRDLVTDEDVVLVEVDGRPVTVPMLEFLMDARGVEEDDHESMRELLDELVRLRVMASAAAREDIADQPRIRAERLVKDLEVQYVRYLERFQRDHPISESEVRAVYQGQIEAAGERRYRLETVSFDSQAAALDALDAARDSDEGFDQQIRRASSEGRLAQRTDWVNATHVPVEFAARLDDAERGEVIDALLPHEGQWVIVRVAEIGKLEPPPFEEVAEGIRRALHRQRNQALIDEQYDNATITPMLPLDQPEAGPAS